MKKALDFIAARLAATGIAPSYDEMGAALGLKSKSNIHRPIIALERRGHIERVPMLSRSIRIRTKSASPALVALLAAYKQERQGIIDSFPESLDPKSEAFDPGLALMINKMTKIIADAERALA